MRKSGPFTGWEIVNTQDTMVGIVSGSNFPFLSLCNRRKCSRGKQEKPLEIPRRFSNSAGQTLKNNEERVVHHAEDGDN